MPLKFWGQKNLTKCHLQYQTSKSVVVFLQLSAWLQIWYWFYTTVQYNYFRHNKFSFCSISKIVPKATAEHFWAFLSNTGKSMFFLFPIFNQLYFVTMSVVSRPWTVLLWFCSPCAPCDLVFPSCWLLIWFQVCLLSSLVTLSLKAPVLPVSVCRLLNVFPAVPTSPASCLTPGHCDR